MPKINTRVTLNKASVRMRIKAAEKKALFAVSSQALKDANKYCPKDHGDLINSSNSHSDLENGILKWATIYARYQYYGVVMEGRPPKIETDTPLKYTKSGAHKKWADYARTKHGKEWKKVYQAELRRLMREG